MKRFFIFSVLVVTIMAALVLISAPLTSAAPRGEPIVIGYVGNVASPGTRPCMDVQKMAVEELNAANGIMGRPAKYVVMDGKGDTSVSVEGARKLIIEDRAKIVFVEGRSEICYAVQETSAMLFKEYPHILVFNSALSSELTDRVLDHPGKYDHCFRDYDPDPAQFAQTRYFMKNLFKDVMKAKRIAILWEDLTWSTELRRGIPSLNLPPWEKMAGEFGLEVVYSKALKPRGTLYFPILQQISAAKADLIWYISSWFTDTESFTKQWAESAAKDIQVMLWGGVSQTRDFWKMTGGKCLGVVSSYFDFDQNTQITPLALSVSQKARQRGIPMQPHVHMAYSDIYHFKNAVEYAKGADDIKKLIKGMEEVITPNALGKMQYETQKVKPFYHSKRRVDPKDPLYKTYPGHYYQLIGQFQKGGKFVFLTESCPENEKAMKEFLKPEQYKKPADLRM